MSCQSASKVSLQKKSQANNVMDFWQADASQRSGKNWRDARIASAKFRRPCAMTGDRWFRLEITAGPSIAHNAHVGRSYFNCGHECGASKGDS
jgi:hypothetical protein